MTDDTSAAAPSDSLVTLHLSSDTSNGRARELAFKSRTAGHRKSTSLVAYRSSGSLLIIDQFKSVGDEDRAVELAKGLRDQLECTVLLGGVESDGKIRRIDSGSAGKSVNLITGSPAALSGHLGQFTVTLQTPDSEINLAQHVGTGRDCFDLILDLSTPPHLSQDIVPLGYYAPRADTDALEKALDDIPGMIGEFEKPKFFNYDPNICAHGSRGLTGCTRCIDVCPTEAITSIGDKIEVDLYLCQGAGSCATMCPTGAITYAYPTAADLLHVVRTVLKHYRDAGGARPSVLFHDSETGLETLTRISQRLPEHIIPIEVEEVGAVGMDTWLAALAYGAHHVLVLATAKVAPSVLGAVTAQLEYAGAVLEGMGYPLDRVQLIVARDDSHALDVLGALPVQPEIQSASFASVDEKRTTIRLAVDHLYSQAPTPAAVAPLPSGAPFGEINVAGEGCTLCMACVSVCPHSALSDGGELPRLLFDEWNCVQCGLCETACPEHVITRIPRFIYDAELRRTTRTLHEEEPFACVTCGKPFSTKSMMDKMQDKLQGHWMFQKPEVLRRMRMCEDCRIKDMLIHEGLIDVHKET